MRPFALCFLFVSACALCASCGPKHVPAPAPVDQGSFLVHRVTSQGETVRSVTRWYTGSEKLVRQIAKESKVGEAAPLKVGQRVLIPLAYVKKTTPPPKQKPSTKSPKVVKGVKQEKKESPLIDETGNESGQVSLEANPSDPSAWTVVPTEVGTESTQVDESTDPHTVASQTDVESAAAPDVVTTKPVESFEELLLKEQLEVERLRREMQAAPPAEQAVVEER